jgi:hypothetical protein
MDLEKTVRALVAREVAPLVAQCESMIRAEQATMPATAPAYAIFPIAVSI